MGTAGCRTEDAGRASDSSVACLPRMPHGRIPTQSSQLLRLLPSLHLHPHPHDRIRILAEIGTHVCNPNPCACGVDNSMHMHVSNSGPTPTCRGPPITRDGTGDPAIVFASAAALHFRFCLGVPVYMPPRPVARTGAAKHCRRDHRCVQEQWWCGVALARPCDVRCVWNRELGTVASSYRNRAPNWPS
jgi:hypothetical protein